MKKEMNFSYSILLRLIAKNFSIIFLLTGFCMFLFFVLGRMYNPTQQVAFSVLRMEKTISNSSLNQSRAQIFDSKKMINKEFIEKLNKQGMSLNIKDILRTVRIWRNDAKSFKIEVRNKSSRAVVIISNMLAQRFSEINSQYKVEKASRPVGCVPTKYNVWLANGFIFGICASVLVVMFKEKVYREVNKAYD
ncbi:MAG: hypothetical protein LBL38_01285 [Lactobacillales bacterium]|nr:hypothetical protein [Lactobacillales bacterium]